MRAKKANRPTQPVSPVSIAHGRAFIPSKHAFGISNIKAVTKTNGLT